MSKPRGRALGLDFPGVPGPYNAITDVPGVRVGYTTLCEERPTSAVPSSGLVRTGVTAILPYGHDTTPRPVWAGQFSLNGNGEMTGSHWIHDGGYLVGPICITNTHSVGMVHHAVTRWMIAQYADVFREHHLWAMPVVAETYDGVLNDINGQHVGPDHAQSALDGATSGVLAEGNVGGGAGMICYEFKGGTGTASRRLVLAGETYTVGVLVQANHGRRDWLTILGVPVGRELRDGLLFPREQGSIIVIIGTDAPLSSISLRHVAKRAAIGIGRHGTPGGNSSGDIFLAFSIANPMELPQLGLARQHFDYLNPELLDPLYLAVVEAVEEAVVNALVAAESLTTIKPPDLLCRAIDHEALREVMGRYGRLKSN